MSIASLTSLMNDENDAQRRFQFFGLTPLLLCLCFLSPWRNKPLCQGNASVACQYFVAEKKDRRSEGIEAPVKRSVRAPREPDSKPVDTIVTTHA
jgi:hypothetical protein